MEPKKDRPILRKFIITLIILLFIFLLVILYSYFIGSSGLKVKEYNIKNSNITDEFYGLKIVQISDIHYGYHFNKDRLEKVVKKINELKPDIVVLTGDLVNSKISTEQENELKEELSKIEVSIGKYAIKGNHDYNFKNWEYVMEISGFINLNDTYTIIHGTNSNIMISGISTNLYGEDKINDKLDSSKKYLENNNVNYKILLIHEPDYMDEINDISYNLILAGHSHNGQIRLPFIGAIYTPKGSKKYYKEYYKINDTDMYISSGLGNSVINLRLLNKPSISFYRLTN